MNDTVVYTLSDADGVPLYVGMTRNLKARLCAHRQRSWHVDVATVEQSEPLTRAEALDLERQTIWRLQPRHNRTWWRAVSVDADPSDEITAREAMRILGYRDRSSISRLVESRRLHPVRWLDGPSESGAAFFRRSEVEALKARKDEMRAAKAVS